MIRILRIPLAALLMFACSLPALANESAFPDIQGILDRGKLLVAIRARDAAPMIMTDDQGRVAGFDADLARDIGEKLGVPVTFVRVAETYDGVVDIVARKDADIAVSFLSSGVGRAMKVLFSQPYVAQNRRIFFNRASFAELRRQHRVQTIGQLANTEAAEELVFGVLEGSIFQKMLARDMPQFAVKTFPDLPKIVTAVKAGEIFAGLHGELQIDFYMRQNPATAIYVAVEPVRRNPSDISIAVRPDAPNLLHWVNIYLANHVGLLDSAGVRERYREERAKRNRRQSR